MKPIRQSMIANIPAAVPRPASSKTEQAEEPQDERVQVIVLDPGMMEAMFQQMGMMMRDPEVVAMEAALSAKFEELEQAGYKSVPQAPGGLLRSTDAGFEALVRFKNDRPVVVPFQSTQDLEDFSALVKGQGSAELQSSRQGLTQLEGQGDSFYFARGGGRIVGFLPLKKGKAWLPTDAAGAAMLLRRGETVTRVTTEGAVDELKSTSDLQKALAASRPAESDQTRAGRLIQALELQGAEVMPDFELPENIQVTDMKGMAKEQISGWLMSQFRDDPRYNSILHRQAMTEALAGGGHVQVLFSDSEEPLALNVDQLEKVLRYEAAPTAEMRQFQETFKELTDDKTLLLARGMAGMNTGQLGRADVRSAWVNLASGGEVVALKPDGDLQSLKTLEQLKELKDTGEVAALKGVPVDPNVPKTNLFMLYFVSPFDPEGKGIYEDLPLRVASVGSSEHADMVTLRSDLPKKQNVRREYIQPGDFQELEVLPKDISMADPAVLEEFVYKSIQEHPKNERIRLMVAGHGGAEKGLLPDGTDNNAAAHNAMAVDDFAGAISKALDRIEAESGERPQIDNLVVGSCLMGNTSFINALASRGDVKALSASPEVLMGNDPRGIFEYLNDPATAKADAFQYARDLVEIMSDASAFPDGKMNLQFADTFGAYDLDTAKNATFVSALNNFFEVCAQHPESAAYIKEDVAACPTYGVNKIFNTMMDVDDRDIIQVAERIGGDARIKSADIKEACDKLVEAASDQILSQKVGERYTGRKGATLYLPVDKFDFDEAMSKTELLSTDQYKNFMDILFQAPARRNVVDNVFTEINRVTSSMRGDKPPEESEEAGIPKEFMERELPPEMKAAMQERAEARAVQDLELPLEASSLVKAGRAVRSAVRQGGLLVGAAVGGAAGAVIGIPLGAVLGGVAGLRGRSVVGGGRPIEEKPEEDKVAQPGGLMPMHPMEQAMSESAGTIAKLAFQAALTPSEIVGQTVNQKVGYKVGTTVGRLAGVAVGLPAGAVGGALSGAVVGGALGGLLGRGIASVATFWLPGEPQKPQTRGLEEMMMMGM